MTNQRFEFKHVRDYEIATSRILSREYILQFIDNPPPEEQEGNEEGSNKRAKGVYYAPLSTAQTLRKRRPRVR